MTAATRPHRGAPPAVPYDVPSKSQAFRGVVRMLLGDVSERMRGRVGLPRSVAEITPEWLTAALCGDSPGAKVTAASVRGGSSGTTTRSALAVTYNEAGRRAALPENVFVKSTASRMQRILFGLGGSIGGEPGFYNHVRPMLEIEAPRSYYAAVEYRSWRYIALLEDVAATRGAVFWEPGTVVSRGQVEDLLASMAAWHAAYWDRPELGELRWLKTPADHLRLFDSMVGLEQRARVGAKRAREMIPPSLRRRQLDLYEGIRRSMEILSRAPHTYLHGDSHVGNIYRTRDGRMGFSDWQIGLRGSWAFDYAYLVTSALEVADRRAWEHELLDFYRDRLALSGAPRIPRAAALQAYREALFYPYFAWAYTIGRAWMQPQFQPDEVSLVIIERTSAAIDDLDSLGAVGL
jgi:phosphotransferase family enzyme